MLTQNSYAKKIAHHNFFHCDINLLCFLNDREFYPNCTFFTQYYC